MDNRASQRGSAIVYVFIGVALFGSLMFLFSRGASQNTSTASGQQGKIKSSEIMERADVIARSVDRLMANGCSINEINFYADHFTQSGTANPSAPSDGHCDVYSPKGGRLEWEGCPDPTICKDPYLYAPFIPRSIVGNSLGSVPEDLVYFVLVRKDVCQSINASLGLPTTDLPSTAIDGSAFIGTFSKDNAFPSSPADPKAIPFIGTTAGCMYWQNPMMSWGGEYFIYYKVLVVL